MIRTTLAAAVLLVALIPLRAEDWEPLPPQVWAIKDEPARGYKDAVVLESRTCFRRTYNEYVYRVRIFSEAGRQAAELPVFSQECYDFKGRVSYPDGRSVSLSKRQDFSEVRLSSSDGEAKGKRLVPPGITSDCVFELRWLESSDHENELPVPPRMGFYHEMPYGASYATLYESVEMPLNFPYSFVPLSSRKRKVDYTAGSRSRVFSMKDLPAFKGEPFSLDAHQERPVFITFWQPEELRRAARTGDVDDYWRTVAGWFWRNTYESEVKRGSRFKALAQRILPQCTAREATRRAAQILTLLDQELINTGNLTYAENAVREKRKPAEAGDLEEAIKRGEISPRDMTVLFFQLLREAGMKPVLASVTDREDGLFRYGLTCPFQFNRQLVGVREGQGFSWLDPHERYAPQGMILPNFQATPALLIEPDQDWNAREVTLPVQTAEFNRRTYTYEMNLGEGELRFKARAGFSGYPEYAERCRYLNLEAAEQGKRLRKEVERRLKGATLQRAEVLNATDPKRDLCWEIEGVLEVDAEARRKQVDPFPGMLYPFYIPDTLEPQRTLPVVPPYLQSVKAQSTILLPPGMQLPLMEPMKQQNRFGTVTWTAEARPKGDRTEAVVTLEIALTEFMAPAEAWGEFRTWLGWLKDAYGRVLMLEKAR